MYINGGMVVVVAIVGKAAAFVAKVHVNLAATYCCLA